MHGELRGRGTARYANGDVYTGEFEGLARHGAGECKYAGGASVYEGQWVADRHEGHGRLSSRRGEEFEGEWLAGQPHGQVPIGLGSGLGLGLALGLPLRLGLGIRVGVGGATSTCTCTPSPRPSASPSTSA